MLFVINKIEHILKVLVSNYIKSLILFTIYRPFIGHYFSLARMCNFILQSFLKN